MSSECDSAMLWRREPGLGKLRKVEARCIDSGVGLLHVIIPRLFKRSGSLKSQRWVNERSLATLNVYEITRLMEQEQ